MRAVSDPFPKPLLTSVTEQQGMNTAWTFCGAALLGGVVISFLSYLRRRQEIKERQWSEAQLRALVLRTADFVWEITYESDGAFRVTYVSEKFSEILGYPAAEMLGKTLSEWLTILRAEPTFAALLTNQQTITHLEERVFHQNGQPVYLEVNAIPIISQTGKFLGYRGASKNITQRHQSEQALRENEQKLAQEVLEKTQALLEKEAFLRLVMDNLPQGVFWKDERGVYLGGNQSFARQVNLENPEALVGKTDDDWGEETTAREAERHVMETNVAQLTEQIAYQDGKTRWVATNRIPLHDKKGQVVGILGLAEDVTSLRQIQAALQEANERFSTLLESLEAVVYVADMQTYELLFTNHYVKQLVKEEPLVGKLCWQILQANQTGPCPFCTNDKLVDDHGEPTGTYTWEFQNTLTKEWFFIQDRAIRWTDGRLVRLEIATNISQQKCVEEALRNSQERFELAMRGANEGLWDWDLSTNEVYFSPRWKRLLGYDEHEIAHTFEEFRCRLHAGDKARVLEITEAYLKQQIPALEMVFRMQHKDGHYVWILSRAFGLWNENGEAYRLVGTHVDITTQKQAEAQLQAALTELSQFKFTLDTTLDYITIYDADTKKFIYANQGAMQQVGYSQTEFLEMTPDDINPTLKGDKLEHLIASLRHNPQAVIRIETQHRHKNGQMIPIELSLQYIQTTDGQGRIVSLARDISERQQTETALLEAKEAAEVARHQAENANRAKSAFLANMSHELRTPLSGILGYAQILLNDKSLTSSQVEGVQVIQRSGEYLLTLINDVLDLSKIEAGRIELSPTDFHFGNFMQGLIDLFKMRASQKGITFIYHSCSTLPTGLHADEKRLRQILINLLGNALKFTEQGKVVLTVGYEDSLQKTHSSSRLRFQIEDTGVGIAPEDLDKIFLPFHQVGTHKYKAQGTGLGLPITKKLIEMMEGELHVESVVGTGSKFWLILDLPISSSITEPVLKKAASPRQPARIIGYTSLWQEERRYKILVVDDTWGNRLVMVNWLSPLGFEVKEAADGQEALEVAKEYQPDLIFMDLVMPVMDGLEATRQLRALPELQKVVIIAASASVFDVHQQESLVAGCNDFISKPLQADKLFELLQNHLNLKWLYEQVVEQEKAVPVASALIGPLPQQAAILWNLARQGDIMGILDFLKSLEEADPKLIPFAAKIRELANNFEDEQIRKMVEEYLGKV